MARRAKSFVRKRIWRWLAGRQVSIGDRTYLRRLGFQNQLAQPVRHEVELRDIYESLFRLRSGAFIDVGMNRGQTLLAVLHLDPERRYVGFEPQIGPTFMAELFVNDNRLTNHTILPIGLSNAYEVVPINVRGSGLDAMFSTSASMVDSFRPDSFYDLTKPIFVAPGDEVIPRLGLDDIAVLKVDVEGAELEVIEGLAKTIDRYRPHILFEVLNHYLVITNEGLGEDIVSLRESRVAQLENALRAKDYVIFQIAGDDELRKVTKIVPEATADLSATNYLAVPSADVDRFVADISHHRRVTATTP